MRRGIVLVVLAAWVMMMTACNTLNGLGEDVEATGEAIQDATE